MVIEIVLSSCENSWLDICSDRNLADLELYSKMLLRYGAKMQVNCAFFSIVWTIAQLCSGCVFHLSDEKSCCRIELAQSRNLFLQGNSWIKRIDLVGRVVASHLMVGYRMKYRRPYTRLDWQPLIWRTSTMSIWHPIIAQMWSRYGNIKVGIVVRLRIMSVESRRYARVFGVRKP